MCAQVQSVARVGLHEFRGGALLQAPGRRQDAGRRRPLDVGVDAGLDPALLRRQRFLQSQPFIRNVAKSSSFIRVSFVPSLTPLEEIEPFSLLVSAFFCRSDRGARVLVHGAGRAGLLPLHRPVARQLLAGHAPPADALVRLRPLARGSFDPRTPLVFVLTRHFYVQVYEASIEGVRIIEVDTWLQVIPQLIARIDTQRQLVGRLIHQLLMDIGKAHPQVGVSMMDTWNSACEEAKKKNWN